MRPGNTLPARLVSRGVGPAQLNMMVGFMPGGAPSSRV